MSGPPHQSGDPSDPDAEQGGADFEWYLNNGMIDRFMLKDEFAEEFAEMFEG